VGDSYVNLRAELRARLGNRGTTLPDSRLDGPLRHAIVQLSSPVVHKHQILETRFSLTTANGQAAGASADEQAGRYTTPIALWTIYSMRDVTNNRKIWVSGRGAQDMVTSSPGQPRYYSRWGRQLEFDPRPNGIFTINIHGYAKPTFTFGGGPPVLLQGSCPLDDEYDEGVLLGAEYRCWFNVLQDPKRGLLVKNQLADWMETIVSPDEGDKDDQGDTMIVDMEGYTQ